jgi:hypothetical protein
MSPDPIFIRFLEVTFCSKKPNFIQAALRDLTKKTQFLSKRVMRDLGVLSGVLTRADLQIDKFAEPSGASTRWSEPRADTLFTVTATKASERDSVPFPLSILLAIVPVPPAILPDMKTMVLPQKRMLSLAEKRVSVWIQVNG